MRALMTVHPSTISTPIDRIEVEVERAGSDELKLVYRAFGDVRRVRLPESGKGRTDELWRSTCFEAFVRPVESPRYLEVNASPSGQWATYWFDSQRRGMTPAVEEPKEAPCRDLVDSIGLAISLPIGSAKGDWRLGLSAVIEDIEGGLSYWALAHPSDKPDFHHPDSFTLVLPALEHP